uniref:SSD domain-containing protein n=1 Tax=Parascaris univalens TaxID=6257 RepID=A0A915BTG8_PARUN
ILMTTFLILTPIISYFIWYPLNIETDIRRGFADKNGASIEEFERFANFYNVSMDDFEIFAIIITSKDGPFVPLKMSTELCDDISRLSGLVTSLSFNSSKYGIIDFNEFKVAKGSINHAFNAFKFAYGIQNALAPNFDKSIILSYPNSFVYGYTLSLAPNIFAAKVNERFQEEGLATAVEYVDAIGLFYIMRASGYAGKERLQLWEIKLLQQSEMHNFSEHFDFYLYGDQLANYEAERGHVKTIWMLFIGVVLMFSYMAYVIRTLPIKMQVVLTFMAILSPLLACATVFAILGWLDVPHNSVMSLIPPLVLGIGVDDAFLLLHTWRKNAYISDGAERMRRVISDIGPSITITSLTNVVAFSVGALSPAKMSLFSAGTAVAMAFDYVFELAVFAPCLLLTLRWEKDGDTVRKSNEMQSFWWYYAKFVLSKSGRICALLTVVLLYLATFLGLQKMEATFDASKTFSVTSPLKRSVDLFDIIYKQYAPINFVIRSSPNFTDPNDSTNFLGMIERLESRPEAYGRERTLFWLFGYIEFCRNELGVEMSIDSANYSLSLDYLDRFAKSHIIGEQNLVQYHLDEKGHAVIDSFLLTIIYTGKDGWHLRAQLSAEIREFLRDYAQYNITMFNYDSPIFELITSINKELAKSVVITLSSMACVCFIFVPSIVNAIAATLSILSISCSLLGMLSWLGLDLDPITMINVLMAIGFSVDFSAHTCYHFYFYERTHPATLPYGDDADGNVAKLTYTFHAIGSPLIQAGASTVFCMLPLFTISSYVVRSFAKTVCLLVALGILHGLFIVPSLLSVELWPRKDKSKQHPTAAVSKLDGNDSNEDAPMM